METNNGETAMEGRRQLNYNAATLKNPSTPLSTKAVHSYLDPKASKGLCSPNLVCPCFAASLPEAQGDYCMSFLQETINS